ncbi:MAG TPA: FAD-dependent oxidoreductase [Acidimicrobiales bacterium]|nr:FAD-dependent oxidoreductase [Acidimicrobiales bacterium]
MTEWDSTFDVVIVGSGGGGMVAALAAADAGASTLVLEKQEKIGGSTCMSGGILWVPNNSVMRAAGEADSYEDALIHFETVVGDVGACSSLERRSAFLTAGPQMVDFLIGLGIRLVYCRGYSDYYSSAKGGHDVGRGIEPVPYNGRKLGPWLEKLQPGLAQSLGLSVMTNEARSLSNYNRSLRAFAISARVVMRTAAARIRRQALLTNGASLIAQALKVALERGVSVWTEAPLEDLIVEDGRVVGVRTVRDGSPVLIRATRGVLLASGGFAHNSEMRQQYGGDQPNKGRWTMSNAGDTGEVIQTAMRLGAKTDLMDEAWWLPSPKTGRFAQSTLDQARQRPRTMYVDAAGQRFVNESNSYMEVGKAMYARNKTSKAVPCWLIFDDRYRKRYAHQRSRPGHFPKSLHESGLLKQAPTLEELAIQCEIDPQGLADTVAHFNEGARQGIDPDYDRGESAYNRALGDPNRRVHPCLGPLDEAPYYAVQVLPGDIGTCGGLVTNEHAQVVGQDDQPIEGLYATGNGTATVMGRHYLGPGASIANTMVFGYVAALHAMGQGQEG